MQELSNTFLEQPPEKLIAAIKQHLTQAMHHHLTDLILVDDTDETGEHHVQLDLKLRLDRQIWLVRALMQQSMMLRDLSIVAALHRLPPEDSKVIRHCYALVKPAFSRIFSKEMVVQTEKIFTLKHHMVEIYQKSETF